MTYFFSNSSVCFSTRRHSDRQLEKVNRSQDRDAKPWVRRWRIARLPKVWLHRFRFLSRLRMHACLAIRTGHSRQLAHRAARRTGIQPNGTNKAVLCEATVTTANPPHVTPCLSHLIDLQFTASCCESQMLAVRIWADLLSSIPCQLLHPERPSRYWIAPTMTCLQPRVAHWGR